MSVYRGMQKLSQIYFQIVTFYSRSLLHPSTVRYSSSKLNSSSERIGVKELIQRDLKHAEELGVLKPASPDANGFRKFIHTAIELSVRSE